MHDLTSYQQTVMHQDVYILALYHWRVNRKGRESVRKYLGSPVTLWYYLGLGMGILAAKANEQSQYENRNALKTGLTAKKSFAIIGTDVQITCKISLWLWTRLIDVGIVIK